MYQLEDAIIAQANVAIKNLHNKIFVLFIKPIESQLKFMACFFLIAIDKYIVENGE